MGKEALVERFQRFLHDYLDTPAGREHRQSQLREQKEVQDIYRDLRAKQQSGEDVTDDVLKRLLPYADNKGNRERGNRISHRDT